MSSTTATALSGSAPLRGPLRKADDDLGDWLKGLVTGEGSSPSQVIISGTLGVVPGLGQAVDVRDLVLGIIAIAKAPTNPLAWLDVTITLIGCIPVMGDALKTGFKLLRGGHSLPRILDATSPALRGNLENWFKTIDWGQISKTVKGGFDDAMAAFINGLDSWVARTVLGKKEVADLIKQLRELRAQAPKMLDEAINELRALWSRALSDVEPRSMAAVGTPNGVVQGGGAKPAGVAASKAAAPAPSANGSKTPHPSPAIPRRLRHQHQPRTRHQQPRRGLSPPRRTAVTGTHPPPTSPRPTSDARQRRRAATWRCWRSI